MDAASKSPVGMRCPRCLVPVEYQARRCPNCGQPIHREQRNLTLWIGIGGVTAILFVIGLMWMVVRNDDLTNAPPPVDEATEAQKPAPKIGELPTMPEKPVDSSKQDKPEKPDKPPPLNQ